MAVLISTPQQLHDIRNDLNSTYELINDIDMSGWGQWLPIGSSVANFTGNFDGKGFKIFNLTLNELNVDYRGLFAVVSNAIIQNVGLENVDVKGRNYVGALSGSVLNSTTISNCYVTGNVNSYSYAGGLVGRLNGSTISNSYADVTVYGSSGSTNASSDFIGGFIGQGVSKSTIKNCYSIGNVSNMRNTASGFIGSSTTTFDSIITNSFWDMGTSGLSTSNGGGTRKTTSQLKTQSTYSGWDFTDTWLFENDYPTLKVFSSIGQANKESINVNSFVNPIQSKMSKSNKSTRQLKSHFDNILSHSYVRRATIRSVEGYNLPIESNATQSNRTVKSKTVNVLSSISPIHSIIDNYGYKVVNVTSHLKHIETIVDVLTSMRDIPVLASVSVVVNPSMTSCNENVSQLNIVENPSTTSHRKNISHLSIIENPSFLEVI